MQGDKRQKQQPKMQRMPGNGINGFGMYGGITPAPGVAQAVCKVRSLYRFPSVGQDFSIYRGVTKHDEVFGTKDDR